MVTNKKAAGIIGIMVLSLWLSFLFLDNASGPRISEDSNQKISDDGVIQIQKELPQPSTENPDLIASQLEINDTTIPVAHGSAMDETFSPGSGQDGALDVSQQQASIEDIHALETIYASNPDTKILTTLIQRLASSYQFKDANKYLKILMNQPDYERLMDVNVILYVLFHSETVSLEDPTSINFLSPLIQQYRSEGLLTKDDEAFYQGMIQVRFQKYNDATALRATVTSATYTPLIQAYAQAINEASGSLNTPAYYKDALISLSLLKHGYFSVAKKIALSVVMKNTDYILPYQILAYANFLSNNRDVAAEYFLKLADFDSTNKDQYVFLVGACYYWLGDYEQSILFLNQVVDTTLLTDVYRYKLLDYLAGGDMENAIRIRQNLLGQKDLLTTDFASFFKTLFYLPYRSGQPFTVYRENKALVTLYLDACTTVLDSGADVCTYGEVGLALANSTWAGIGDKLVYLSSTYHQSYLYHVLGDYYFSNNEYALAKDAYSQALSICDDKNESIILQDKLSKVMSK